MCGITGICGEGGSRALIEKMTARLQHRGPDDSGVFEAEGIRLGHRRLTIIDLSEAGRQPMTHGDLTITYNGEIYNYRELRRQLSGPFRTNSDTEVILHLYAKYGERCVDHLQGMFAFAIWDAAKKRLFAARDRLGIKPFFYRKAPFAFASEIKALLETGPAKMNPKAPLPYLVFKYVPGEATFYEGIWKLPPGCSLTFDGSNVSIQRYWNPESSCALTDPDEAAGQLQDILKESIVSHTVADVPVGVFLSGGVDSSAIVSHLTDVKTFSIGFDIQQHSETEYARLIAEKYRTEHVEEMVKGVDLEEALDSMPEMYDEPFGDSSAWATHIVSRVARKQVKATLSGEGGDEVFSGYGWYSKWMKYHSSAPARILSKALPPFSSAGRSMHRRGAEELERYVALVGAFSIPQARSLLAPEFCNGNPLDAVRSWWREDLTPIKRMQWMDLNTFLPDDLLVKVDRASMAVSLEVRPPFLDHRLVEFALKLDPVLLRNGDEGKLLLKRVLQGRVPDEILTRPKKGFSMPVRRWLKERPELIDEAMKRLKKAGVFRTDKRPRLEGEQMWGLLVLDRWVEKAGI